MYVIVVIIVICIIAAYVICTLMSLEMLRKKVIEIWNKKEVMK